MSEPANQPRGSGFPLQHVRRIAAGLRGRDADSAQLANSDEVTSSAERYQEVRRHVAAGLFVVLLVAIGAILLILL